MGESAFRLAGHLGVELSVEEIDLGPDRYRRSGEVLSEETVAYLSTCDALFVGSPPVGGSDIPPGLLERGIVYGLRSRLDLFVNVRAFEAGALDIAVVREISEGAYLGEGGVLRPHTRAAVATQGSVNTYFGVERCTREAFAMAARRRKVLTLLHKPMLSWAEPLWREVVGEAAADYPDVKTDYLNVDTACIHLVEDPSRFDVLLTDNLFGDIISDLVGALSGALYRSASSDLNAARTGPSLFEPIHGVLAYEPDGDPNPNPLPAYAALGLMLDYLGLAQANALRLAVRNAPYPAGRTLHEIEENISEAAVGPAKG